ncbi:MAG: glycosyltransferase [Candidatus Diapherotrites archaeon]
MNKSKKSGISGIISVRLAIALALVFLLAFFLIKVISFYWTMVFINIIFFFTGSVFVLLYFESKEEKNIPVSEWPSVSVLIPVYNAEKTIENCINAVKQMSYPQKFEIIAVNDGSTDNSLKLLKSIKGIKILDLKKNQGKAAALNIALKKAKGEIVACIDSDTFPAENCLMEMVPAIMHSDTAAVTGLVKVSNPDNFIANLQELEYIVAFGFYQTMLATINAVIVTPGPMSIYKRKILLDIGGYDEHNITEDMEIAFRLQKHGYKIRARPKAHIYTEVPLSMKGWVKQRTRWYRGKVVNVKKYSELIFNPKYNHLGMFSLPFSFAIELAAVFMVFLFIVMNLENASSFLLEMLSWVSISETPVIPLSLMLHSSIYFAVLTVLFFVLTLYFGFKITGEKFSLVKIPQFLFFILIYGLFISFVWIISLFKEINESEYSW